VNATHASAEEAILDLTNGLGVDYSVESIGKAPGMDMAVRILTQGALSSGWSIRTRWRRSTPRSRKRAPVLS
jgi:hypothetical protein